MSAYEGTRLLYGAAGTKVHLLLIRGSAADPHELEVTRERITTPEMTSRMADGPTGYVRVLEFTKDSPTRLKQAIDALSKTKATRFLIDIRGTARGDLDDGIATARLFVKSGTLASRQTKGDKREAVTTGAGDGAIAAPVVLLVDQGTAGAAEVFAAALSGNQRAALVGEQTLGRAARQQLVRLPDGSALFVSTVRYLTPKGEVIHEKGLQPDDAVEQPEVEFGAEAPAVDATLQKGLERNAKS